ncbi:glycerophosphoryl diester phosphodiesterase membrane domain-containing protein [Microbacterium sp. ASV81]|uniref:Glycerophosphoryl diester phosphodiesterase membrane domain-containing protein n=1 Tax=Microbacterium capsulatum TaxID=3041921 RepID=A0ABU0XJW5_9MICO|nr:glycerophosphoryl diester phosphodiesterase membrane domain-containing protein [Microbacterium sp. ASV81]MDQ4215413.1 glycerophosphoryl diester phosphodiesterase membrane domain-containing protein [Microbacterium sp. ASV81]
MTEQRLPDQGWTPAPKPGLIPLRPLGFGTILGKAFAALRHNPKVLFGFAVVVQLVVMVVTAVVIGAVAFAAFSRLQTVSPASDEYVTLMVGSAAIVGLTGLLLGLLSVAFSAIVQGIVAADVRAAVLRESAVLPRLWARVKPAAWRLIGYTLLYGAAGVLAVLLVVAVAFGAIAAPTGFRSAGVGFAVLAMIPGLFIVIGLAIWIGIKLMLVPSILVLEGTGIRTAIARSWRLTRRRWWFAFGIMVVIVVATWLAAQAIGLIGGLVTSLFGPVLDPTGQTLSAYTAGTIVSFAITELVVVVLQAISAVVQSTAGVLVYVDCRMRYEGLDQDLMATVERRAAGRDDGSDPFRVDPARAVGPGFRPAPAPVPYPYPPGYTAPAGHPAPAGPQPPQGYTPPSSFPAPQPQGYYTPVPPRPAPAMPAAPPPPPPAPRATASSAPPAPAPLPPAPQSPGVRPQDDDPWAAPGSSSAR